MKYYQNSRPEVLALVDSAPKTALDIGCGAAIFSATVKAKFNAEVWGIEMSAEAAQEAALRIDKVLTGTFDQVADQVPNAYFDCIFFNDVLEHMTEPETALKAIRSKLAPDGKVYASIPNFLFAENIIRLFKSKDWEYTDSGILDRTHYRFFTRKSILRLFKENHYQVEVCEPLNAINSRKWKFLGWLTAGYTSDFLPMQYGIVAKPCR